MRSAILAAIVVAAAATFSTGVARADDAPAATVPNAAGATAWRDCAPPCGDPCRRSSFEIQGHASLLTPSPEGIVTFDAGQTDPVTWDSLDYDWVGGGRAVWSFPVCSWTARLGGTYWGQWEAADSVTGTIAVGAVAVNGTPAISPPFLCNLESEATLWGLDAALVHPCICTECLETAWGFGLRYMQFKEQSTLTVPPPAQATPAIAEGDTENGLLAAQLVGEWTRHLTSCWDLRARAAVFGGWLHRKVDVTITDFFGAGTKPTQSAEDDSFGFGAELEVSVGWHPCGNWTVRLGYGGLLMTGIARGDESMDFSNTLTTTLVAPQFGDEAILAHRFFVGVSWDF